MQLNNIAPSVHSQNQSSNLIIVPVWHKPEPAATKDYSLESVQKAIRDNKQVADKTVNLANDLAVVAAQLEGARAQIKKYEGIKRAAEAEILDAMKDASKGVLLNGSAITRRLVNCAEYQVPVTSFITIMLKKGG